jgi:hypothetical protein
MSTVLTGCMTVGRPFPVDRVASLRVEQTTQADVRSLFGEPDRTGVDDGDETWTYLHYRLSVFGDQRTRDLYVRFGPDGRVRSYSFNSSLEEDRGVLDRGSAP